MSGYVMQQVSERHAIPYAGIECRELGCEGKAILQPCGLPYWQREKSQLGLSMWARSRHPIERLCHEVSDSA